MNRKEQQNARRAEKRCVTCGVQDERTMAGKSHCELCARVISKKSKMYRQYKISHGRCAECGNQDERTKAGGFRCASCLSKNQQTTMQWYSRMRQEKRCVVCGKQDDRTLEGKCHCAACYSAKRAKEKAAKKTKKQETGGAMMYNDVRQIVRDRIPERLREARKRANISQAKLADLVGVEKATIAGYERKGRVPAVDIASEIAKALSVSLLWLTGMDNDCDEVQK